MIGNKIIRFDSIDSTSNFVAKSLMSGTYEAGSVILAQYQTSGRGQRDSIWQSSAKENLLISFAVPCDSLAFHQQFLLAKAISVAVHQFLTKTIPTDVKIKWPNDILVGDKKISGLLIETKQVDGKRFAIIGLGLNINQSSFPGELKATSLAIELGQKVATQNVAMSVIGEINRYLNPVLNGNYDEIRQAFLEHMYGKDTWIRCKSDSKEFLGKIMDIDDSGVLLIKSKLGRSESYRAKEIQIIY